MSVQVYDGDGRFDTQYMLMSEATKIILELKGGLILLQRLAVGGNTRMNALGEPYPPLDLEVINSVTAHAEFIYDWLNEHSSYELASVSIMRLGALAAECMMKGFDLHARKLSEIVERITLFHEQRR
jgi:hypothetical protein